MRRLREWELSKDVQDPGSIAALVASDMRYAESGRKIVREEGPRPRRRHTLAASRYAMSPDEEIRAVEIGKLLAGARKGDPEAVEALRKQWRAWVVVGT